MPNNSDSAAGCAAILIGLFSLAWVGFLGWMLYLLVTWLISK